MNAAEKFQRAIDTAIGEAATANVHPALVYTVLGMRQQQVSRAIEQSEQMAAAEAVCKSHGNQSPKTDSN